MDVSSLSTIRQFAQGWKASDGSPAKPLSTWEYLNFSSSMHQAAAFATLFWPEFLVHDDRIFLKERFSSAQYAALLDQGLSGSEAQALMNHVHIDDLLGYNDDAADLETATHLAEVLAQAWAAKIQLDYPGSAARVEIDPGYSDPQVILRNP